MAGQNDQLPLAQGKQQPWPQFDNIEQSYRFLRRTYNDQSARLAEAYAHIATMTSAEAEDKAAMADVVLQLEEANRIAEKKNEEAKHAIIERESELLNIAHQLEERESYWESRLKKEERLRKAAEKRAGELQLVADRLDMAEGRGGYVSASAAVAGELKKSGTSYTQLFTDYVVQETRLESAESEVGRLTDLLDEISQELSEKKPLLDEQAAEHARAIERSNALATELSNVISARDALQTEVKSLQAASSQHTEDVSSLQSTVDDLSHQLQALLRQVAIKDDPSLASEPLDGEAEVGASGDIVTDHLLEYKSIRSLQEQNQRLLKITRKLMAQLDEREIDRAAQQDDDDQAGQTLDQAREMIKKLHKDFVESQKKVDEVSRERDLFSKLLAQGEGLSSPASVPGVGGLLEDNEPHQQTIAALQTELDMIKKTSLNWHRRGDALNDLINSTSTAHAEALREKETYILECEKKIKSLEEEVETICLDWRRNENALREQIASTDTAHAETLRQKKSQIVEAEQRVKSFEEEVERIVRNVEEVARESSGKDQEIQRLQSELSICQAGLREGNEVLTNLNKERDELSEKLAQVVKDLETTKSATSINDSERAESKEKVETLSKEIAEVKERYETNVTFVNRNNSKLKDRITALLQEKGTVQAEADSLKNQVTELETKIQTLETAAAFESSKPARVPEKDVSERKPSQEEIDDAVKAAVIARETELQAEFAKDLEQVKAEKSETKEEGVVQTGQTENNEVLANLQKEKDTLEEKLIQVEKDLEATKAAVAAIPAAANMEKERDELQAKVEKLSKDISVANDRYETNVTIVNRNNSKLKDRITALLQAKSAVQGEVDNLKSQVIELEGKIHDLATSAAAEVETTVTPAAAAPADTSAPVEQPSASVEPLVLTEASAPSASAESAAPVESSAPSEPVPAPVTKDVSERKPSQDEIDIAVKAAVSAREAELHVIFMRDLEEATTSAATAAAAAASIVAPQAATVPAMPIIDAEATAKKTAELEAEFETRVNEAVAKQKAVLEEEVKELKVQVEDLKNKIKLLERRVRTAEITRKTLEKQKNEIEKKLADTQGTPAIGDAQAEKKIEGDQAESEEKKAEVENKQTKEAETTSTQSSKPTAVRRVLVRGKAGLTARPNSVLSAVNATLAQASAPPAESSGLKRPLLEDGEISSPTETGAVGTATTGASDRGRVLKRPRGGPIRGLRGGRGGRGKGAGAGAGAGAGGAAGGAGQT